GEAALVIRTLLRRLGLEADSPQLRCIATSASLTPDGGLEYLEGFFGTSRESFTILPGTPRTLPPTHPLPRAEFAADDGGSVSDEKLEDLLRMHPISLCVANACHDGMVPRATGLPPTD